MSVLERRHTIELVYTRFLYYRRAILEDLSNLSDDDMTDVDKFVMITFHWNLLPPRTFAAIVIDSITRAANSLGASLR